MADIAYNTFDSAGTSTDTSNGTGSSSVSGGRLTVTSGTGAGNRGQRRVTTQLATMADGDVFHVQGVDTGGGQFTAQVVMNFTSGSGGDFRPALSWLGNRWAFGYVNRVTPGDAAGVTLAPADGKMFARFRRSGSSLIGETSATEVGGYGPIVTLSADIYWDYVSFAIPEVFATADDRGTPASSYIFEQFGTAAIGGTPTISSIAPTSGPVGTQVTMTGTNHTGATGATHGPSVAMTGLVVDSATQTRATIASGSPASGTIRLTTPGGTATGPTFTITPIFTSLFINNPNTTYTIGALLLPITVTARDQFGNTFLGTVPADPPTPAGFCSATSLTLPVGVTGTLTEAFVSGIATFDDLTAALISGTLRDLLAGRRAAHYARIMVKDAAGVFRDLRSIGGQDYSVAAVVTRDQEAPASTATITVRAGRGLGSLQLGMSTATQNLTGRLLDVGREFQVWVAISSIGVVPGTGDYDLVFHGRVDTINAASVDHIRCTGRDLSVQILDGVFGSTQSYGSAGGVAVQTVLQQMLDAVLGVGVVTLSTPVSPAWLIVDTPAPYKVKIGTSLYAAMKQLTDQIGWRLAYNYPADLATFQLLGPNRAAALADWGLAASEISEVNDVTFSLEPIRNSVTVQFYDASGVPQTPAVATSSGSIAAYGFRPMVIREAASSEIRTLAQAQRMADAIRDDLALPLLTNDVTHQHAFYPILPGHVIDVLPNGVHFDATTRLAVARTVLTLENGGGHVQLALRGAPASRARGWLDLSGPTADDTDTVTPTMVATPVSIPTNGGSAALHTEWVITGLNPKIGGALPVLRVYFDAARLTVQRWNGSAWIALADGQAITTGSNVRALRAAYGREVLRITFTATVSGGGVDRIVQTVPNQDPVAPAVIATQIASTSVSKTYRITTTIGGLQVRWTGGSAVKTAGLAVNVYGAEPQDYTFARPAVLGPDADALFECTAGAGAGVIRDSDSVTVPAIGRDTIPSRCYIVEIAKTTTTVTVRVSGSAALYGAPFHDGVTILRDTGGASVSSVAFGAIAAGATEYCALTEVVGSYPTAAYYNDYVITRPPIGSLPSRVVFGIIPVPTTISPDNDSVDVGVIPALTPGRIADVTVNYTGAQADVRFRFFDAAGMRRNYTAGADIDCIWTSVSPAGVVTETGANVAYAVGGDFLFSGFVRTAGFTVTARIRVAEQLGTGTARIEQSVPVQTYPAAPPVDTTPHFASVNVVNTGTSSTPGNLNVVYGGANLPAGGSYRLSVDNSTFISSGVFTGTGSSFTILAAGAYTDGTAPPSGKSADRARGTLEMLDSSGTTVAASPLPYNEFFGVI